MAKVGYARISSVGQNISVQRSKLEQCDKIFHETKSGTLHQRPQLQACLEYVREGDTLAVTRLDRLARSTFHPAKRDCRTTTAKAGQFRGD